ncbi:hypothetical protein DSECCO2_226750 [anaerobic digester metagenome]
MPLNRIKIYNQLLDIVGMSGRERTISLEGIFKRDLGEQSPVFCGKEVHPTPSEDGEIPMETLFRHLTTEMTDKKSRAREFELERSKRLHWVRFHLDQRKEDNMLLFSAREPEGIRTYYYDRNEKYVIVLEPLRNGSAYYLLSAYYVRGKDAMRNKIEKKYRRKLDELY